MNPLPADNGPVFVDDESIADNELLYRGLLPPHLPQGPGGPVSPTAFKTRQRDGIRRHVSVYRKILCQPAEVFEILYKSMALGEIVTEDARALRPHVAGVSVAGGHRAHARLIRRHKTTDDEWQVVAARLADACSVTHTRPGQTG